MRSPIQMPLYVRDTTLSAVSTILTPSSKDAGSPSIWASSEKRLSNVSNSTTSPMIEGSNTILLRTSSNDLFVCEMNWSRLIKFSKRRLWGGKVPARFRDRWADLGFEYRRPSQPATHPRTQAICMFTFLLSVSLWYNGLNQFMI